MAPVAGGVNQDIGRGFRHRPVQHRFERFVTGLALVKAQVIAKHNEFFRAPRQDIHHIRQVDQIRFIHLDQAQALGAISV